MDGGAIIGFTTIGVLIVGNITVVAYTYGQLKQKVDDNRERLSRLEKLWNNKEKK